MISINHRLIHRHDSIQCLRERVCSYLRKFLRFAGTTSRNFHFTIYCQLTSSFLIYDSMFQNNGKTSIAGESLNLAICPATLQVSSLLWVPEGRMRCYQNRLIFSFRVLCWCAQSFERFGGGGITAWLVAVKFPTWLAWDIPRDVSENNRLSWRLQIWDLEHTFGEAVCQFLYPTLAEFKKILLPTYMWWC